MWVLQENWSACPKAVQMPRPVLRIEHRPIVPSGLGGANTEHCLVKGSRMFDWDVQKLCWLAPGLSTEQRQGSSITLQVEFPSPMAEHRWRPLVPPTEQFWLLGVGSGRPKVLQTEKTPVGIPPGSTVQTQSFRSAEQRPPGGCPGESRKVEQNEPVSLVAEHRVWAGLAEHRCGDIAEHRVLGGWP